MNRKRKKREESGMPHEADSLRRMVLGMLWKPESAMPGEVPELLSCEVNTSLKMGEYEIGTGMTIKKMES